MTEEIKIFKMKVETDEGSGYMSIMPHKRLVYNDMIDTEDGEVFQIFTEELRIDIDENGVSVHPNTNNLERKDGVVDD